MRLNVDGSLDGTLVQDAGFEGIDTAPVAIVVQPDRKILVGGEFVSYNGVPRPGLARLNPDGSLDESFNPDPEGLGFVGRIELLPDSKILVGGAGIILRLHPNGSVDPSFTPPQDVYTFAVQPDGKILAMSGGEPSTPRRVARFHTDGTPDPTFECGLNPEGWVSAIALPSADTVLIGGMFEEVNGIQREGIARLNNVIEAPRHPADAAPADWTLSSTEVEDYGATWRHGDLWRLPPNPVPIDYVTRAAALWKGGERYRWDSAIAAAPLWWVNVPKRAEPPGTADKLKDDWAVRRAPRYYVPGQAFEISIRLTAASRDGALARALQDSIPPGWQVTAVHEGGALDSAQRQVKWGAFTDTPAHVVRYQVLPPGDATGTVILGGLVSRDGRSEPIVGDTQIRFGGRLGWRHERGEDRIALRLQSDAGTVMVIETSPDLTTWTTMATVTNTTGALDIPVTATGDPQRYYRARILQ